MSDRPLTDRQEKFVLAWVETGNKTEAYRRAYNTEKWADSSVNVKASDLSRNVKVSRRYQELTEAAQKRNQTTVDSIDEMLKRAYEVSEQDLKGAAMVAAAMGLSKLHGLDAETRAKLNADKESASVAEILRDLADRLPT